MEEIMHETIHDRRRQNAKLNTLDIQEKKRSKT